MENLIDIIRAAFEGKRLLSMSANLPEQSVVKEEGKIKLTTGDRMEITFALAVKRPVHVESAPIEELNEEARKD